MDVELKYFGDGVLREKSEAVALFDDSLRELAENMLGSLERFGGIGLAAVQIGKPIRMFVTDTGENGGRLVFVNPEIVASSEDMVPFNEGCLSLPRVYRDVLRPSEVTVSAQDVSGKRFMIRASGLLARVIQHENDHLDGVLFTDRLTECERKRAEKECADNLKARKGKGRR